MEPFVVMAALDEIDSVQDIAFVRNGAKGTEKGTGTTGNAFVILNHCCFGMLVHCDGIDLTGAFTGTLTVADGVIRTDLGT